MTVECNPEDVSAGLLRTYAAAGVTRISLGVQSLVPHVLDSLGRRYEQGAVTEAVAAVGEVGFDSFSVDLIYGAAGETDGDWAATLEGVLGFDPSPPHVSAYALQAEPGTPLGRDPTRHPDDDVQARRYEMADVTFAEAGLGWYEISNWALARPRVPAQPELLAPGRVPRCRLRRPQPSRRAQVLEHPHPRALHGCGRRGSSGGGRRGATRARRPNHRGARAGDPHPRWHRCGCAPRRRGAG